MTPTPLVLVTGASGLLGSAVCRTLRAYGVRYFAHLGSGRSVSARPIPSDVREYATLKTVGDLCAPEHVRTLFRADLWPHSETGPITSVVHCAAKISGIAEQKADPSFAVTDNLCMTARLLEATAKAKPQPKFVFISSSTVYPALDTSVTEDEIGQPDACYEGVGNMKIHCEQLCRFYRNNFGLRYTVLRPTAIYGPGDTSTHVIPDLIRAAYLDTGFSSTFLLRGGNDTRDFVYVDDAAEACVLAAKGPDRPGCAGPFNIGSGVATTLRELASTIKPDWEIHDGGRGSAIPYRQVSIERAAAVLGWAPKTSLEEGLRRTAEWMKGHGRS